MSPKTQYFIRNIFSDSKTPTVVSKSEFDRILDAKSTFSRLAHIEECYFISVDNYSTFEGDLLRASIEGQLHGFDSYEQFNIAQRIINKSLMNFLTANRSYIDQAKQIVSGTFGRNSAEYLRLLRTIENQKGNYLGFRALEELRNYA